jgi:hypothetical protein
MAGALKAQPTADVIIGAMVMQVDGEAAERLVATVASADTELRARIRNPNTEIINRLQLRASDGQNVQLRIGDRYSVRHGVIVDITPRVLNLEEVILCVEIKVPEAKQTSLFGLSQEPAGQTKNVADLRLHEGELNILRSLPDRLDSPRMVNIPVLGAVLLGGSHGENEPGDLMIALTPHSCVPTGNDASRRPRRHLPRRHRQPADSTARKRTGKH